MTQARRLTAAVRTCLLIAFAAMLAGPAAIASAETYNLPRQFSSVQGANGWSYLYGDSPSGPTQASWDNTVSPWGTQAYSSWNGSPRFLYIGGRPIGDWKASSAAGAQMIQTGEHSDVSVGWKAPRAGTVHIAAQLNAGNPDATCCDPYPDDGVWLSLYKGATKLAGEGHVFHGTSSTNRKPNTFLTSTTSVAAGDRLYFYLRRGEWQDSDYAYYSFTVSYGSGGDLTPPQTTSSVANGRLTLSASDEGGSGLALIEYLPDTTGAEWTRYTGPVAVPAGSHRYLIRALDNTGNLGAYRQVTVTGQDNPPPPPPPPPIDPNDEQGGGPPTGATGCTHPTVTFWLVTAMASCFTQQDGKWVAQGRIRINGLDIVPIGSAQITLDPSARRISTSGQVAIRIGTIELYRGTLNWTLDAPSFELTVAGGGEIKGFEITGSAAFSIVSGGVKVEAEVSLPSIPGLPGGLTAGVTLRATNSEGLKLDGLSIELGELPIRGLVLKSAKLSYERTDEGKDRWSGEVTAVLPIGSAVEVMGGMTLLSPPWQVESIKGALDNLNKPVYGPVFLQKIGIEITFLPSLKLAGTIGLSAGPEILGAKALGVEGTLEVALPYGGEPVVVTAKGEVQVVILTLASGEIVWRVPGDVTFSGTLDYGAGIAGLKMTANGWINSSSFLAEGSGQMYVDLYFTRATFGQASALISSRGMASCAGTRVPTLFGWRTVSVGFGLSWGGSLSIKYSGCNVGDYRPSGSRRTTGRQTTPAHVQIPAGQDQVMIGATGADGPPVVTVTSPSGQTIDPETQGQNGTFDRGAWIAMREPTTRTTYFIVTEPQAGTWTVTPAAGYAVTQVGLAPSLAAPKLTASVRRSHGRYRLAWRFRAAAGRSVRFVERTGRSTHNVTSSTKGRGSVSFKPIDDGSRGKRRIEALVSQRGLPRSRRVVARFSGPAPRVLHRPAPVSLRRKGTRVLVRWRRVAGAVRYELRYSVTDGRRHFLTRTPRQQRRLTIPRVSRRERVTVTLRAVGANGLRSPARVSRLRR